VSASLADWLTAIGAVGQLGVLSAAVLYARGQVNEAKELRRAQTRPYVIVYLTLNSVSRFLVELAIENIGATAAHNIAIKIQPQLASTIGPNSSARINQWTPLTSGIPTLAPGQRLSTLFDSLLTRYAPGHSLPRHHEVGVSYQGVGAVAGPWDDTFDLDIEILRNMEYVGEKTFVDLVDEVGAIRSTMKDWSDIGGGLKVLTQDLKTFQEERDQWRRQRIADPRAGGLWAPGQEPRSDEIPQNTQAIAL